MSEKQRNKDAKNWPARGGRVVIAALVSSLSAMIAGGAALAQNAPPGTTSVSPQQRAPAPQPAPPSQPQPRLSSHDGTPATVIDSEQAEGIIGAQIHSSSGADMGRIVDVVVDRTGRVRAAIIDFGGFLGVGTRQIAVDWTALHFPPKGKMDSLVVDLDRNQLKLAPIYKAGEPIVVLGRSSAPAQPPAAPQKHP